MKRRRLCSIKSYKYLNIYDIQKLTKLQITCPNSTIGTLKKGVNYVYSTVSIVGFEQVNVSWGVCKM